jgi:cytochrome c556
MIRKALVVAACLVAANAANAQLGGLGSMLGSAKAGASTGGDIGADVGAFVTKSAALSELAGRSVTAINAAFASDQEIEEKRARLAQLNSITDPKEKQAKFAEMYNSEQAKAQTMLDSGEMEKRIGTLSGDKKKMIGQALLNFGIGSLQAIELTKSGQSLIQKVGMNPMNLQKIVPVKDALPLLGKVAGDAGSFFVGVAKLAKGANISVPSVKADTKPAEIIV